MTVIYVQAICTISWQMSADSQSFLIQDGWEEEQLLLYVVSAKRFNIALVA